MRLIITILFLVPVALFSQSIIGTVQDTSHMAISGVTVSIVGTDIKTTTDQNGSFRLDVLTDDKLLLFQSVGYKNLEVMADTSETMVISLISSESVLDDVQVIAYGTSTQRFNVGSVSTVSAKEIETQAISNPLEALQGRVPGLIVTASSGLPGSSFNVQIRGQNTLKSNASNLISPSDNPLFIIDGVPFAPQNGNINQRLSIQSPSSLLNYGLSPFNNISPSDIESIEVLRDADATAIYGSRGGNGVILITTKKGKAGKTAFNTNINTGISYVGKTMRMMNTDEYLQMRREAITNVNNTPNLKSGDAGYAPDLLLFDTTKYTNWKDFFLGNTAKSTNVNSSISGGSASTQFRLSAGYNRNTYIFPGDYSDNKANFGANIHHNSKDKRLNLDFQMSYSYDKNNSSGTPDLLSAFTMEPNFPDLLDPQGKPIWSYKDITLGTGGISANPLRYLNTKYYIQNKNLIGHLQINYKLLKNLMLSAGIGYNTFNSNEYFANPQSAQDPAQETQSQASFGTNNFETWIFEPQLNYSKTIGKSSIKVLLGGTLQSDNNKSTQMTGYGYLNDALLGSISAAQTTNVSDNFSEYKYSAAFARLNYIYDNKYILNLNGRRDGSSRFGPDRRFGNFGSIGAGWLFSSENSVKELNIISYGKLHGSYGITGSDGVSNYQYLARWAPSNYNYNDKVGYLPQNLFNPLLSWAATKKLEVGIELGFLEDKFLFTGTWFRNRSGNQLISYPLPDITGFNNVSANWNATVQNSGFEFSIHSMNTKSKSFSWSTNFNLTIPQSKLISFPGLETSSYSTTYVVGHSVNSIFGLKYAGVNKETGLFQFYTADGKVTSSPVWRSGGKFNDFQIIGTTDPKFYGGLQNSLSYKNFQLSIFFDFYKQIGSNYLKDVYASLPGTERNLPAELLSRWQKPGDISDFQMFATGYGDPYNAYQNFQQSSGIYSDASYIRLKTLSLSYSLGKNIMDKLGAESVKLYCNAQNLLTFSKYKGNDPETQSFYGVPVLKTIVLGLIFSF